MTDQTIMPSSNGVTAEITSSEGLRRTLKIQAPSERVDNAFEAEYQKLRKSVTLKGFRKGKAPLSQIKAMYKNDVTADVVDRLLNEAYSAALAKLELNVAASPKVSDLSLNEGQPFSFTAEVEVFPEIDSIDVSGLTYTDNSPEVTDEDVTRIIESLRREKAPLTEVDRPAQTTDLITADLKKTEDKGNVIEGDHFPDSVIDLTNDNTVKEFREGLLGAKLGEMRTVTVSYPADYPDKPFAGQSLTYDILVKKIEQRELPELDDAFVKEHAGADSLDQLKERVRSSLKQERESQSAKERNNQLISQVVAKNPVEVPDALVDRYVDDVVADFRKNYPDQLDNEEEVRNRYRVVGANQLRWKLISDKLIEDEKIEVSPEDTDKWIEGFAQTHGMSLEDARKGLVQGGRLNQIRDTIIEEKLMDFLRSKAKVKK